MFHHNIHNILSLNFGLLFLLVIYFWSSNKLKKLSCNFLMQFFNNKSTWYELLCNWTYLENMLFLIPPLCFKLWINRTVMFLSALCSFTIYHYMAKFLNIYLYSDFGSVFVRSHIFLPIWHQYKRSKLTIIFIKFSKETIWFV